MWSIFGLLFTTLGTLYYFRKRRAARWKAKPGQHGEVNYIYGEVRGKSGLIGLKLGIEVPQAYDFSIKSEKWYDRLAKHLRLSAEFQVGNLGFDEKFYIVSEDPRLLSCLTEQTYLHHDIEQLFRLHPKYCASLHEIRCSNGRLWLEYGCEGGFDLGNLPTIAGLVVPSLNKFAADLAALSVGETRVFDRYAVRAAILLAISSGLTANGVLQYFRSDISPVPFNNDLGQLWLHSMLGGAAIIALLIAVTIALLGRTSRAHLVLIEIVFIGSFGAVATVMQELNDINREMDSQPAYTHVVRVYDKQEKTRRKARTLHLLTVTDWRRPGDSYIRLDAPISVFSKVQRGEYLVVHQRQGYLGYPWVERVEFL